MTDRTMTEQSNLSTLEIARLGQRGDGMATDGTIVPYAFARRARLGSPAMGHGFSLVAVETPSPDRIAPFCGYFGTCGGCAVQHLAPEPYAAWKRGNLAQGLAQAGIEVPCEPTRDAHGSGRRRLTLHVREIDGKGVAGLMEARSHALVAIDHCPITVEQLHTCARRRAGTECSPRSWAQTPRRRLHGHRSRPRCRLARTWPGE